MENMAAGASAVMAAYAIYVVAMMVIQAIYACEDEEFTLASKKDVKACQYVGSYCADEILGACIEKKESYCCFNSPLSRIINSQIRPQLARPFGDPENPDCGGISMSEVGSIDWSQVDLGEWTSLLSQYDLMPDANSINMEALTGTGNQLTRIADDGERPDAIERTEARIGDWDIDEIRREAASNTLIDPTGGD